MRVVVLEDGSCAAEELARMLRAGGFHVDVMRGEPRTVDAEEVALLVVHGTASGPARLVHGPLVLDRDSRRAFLHGAPLELLPREWAVLEVLLRSVNRVISKAMIGQLISPPGRVVSANTIETHVSRLRTKLEPGGVRIRTVHRFGYVLAAFAAEPRDER